MPLAEINNPLREIVGDNTKFYPPALFRKVEDTGLPVAPRLRIEKPPTGENDILRPDQTEDERTSGVCCVASIVIGILAASGTVMAALYGEEEYEKQQAERQGEAENLGEIERTAGPKERKLEVQNCVKCGASLGFDEQSRCLHCGSVYR